MVKFEKIETKKFCCDGWIQKNSDKKSDKNFDNGCKVPECGKNPLAKCQNGGRCHKTKTRCVCPKGWGGNTCNRDKNECKNYKKGSLCDHNTQKCVNLMGGFKCV